MSSTIITQQMDSKGGKELLRACSTTDLKGARSRLRARALFRILAAYTIIILDNHGVEIKLQRAAIQ